MIHFHKWSKWTDPVAIKNIDHYLSETYYVHKQYRTCERCNKRKARLVTARG